MGTLATLLWKQLLPRYGNTCYLVMGTLHTSLWEHLLPGYGNTSYLVMGTLHTSLWEHLLSRYGNTSYLVMGTLATWLWEHLLPRYGNACYLIMGTLATLLWEHLRPRSERVSHVLPPTFIEFQRNGVQILRSMTMGYKFALVPRVKFHKHWPKTRPSFFAAISGVFRIPTDSLYMHSSVRPSVQIKQLKNC